jgi:hypothetical protein
MQSNHEIRLQILLVHHHGRALVAKFHSWNIPNLARDRPPLSPLSEVVVQVNGRPVKSRTSL